MLGSDDRRAQVERNQHVVRDDTRMKENTKRKGNGLNISILLDLLQIPNNVTP